MRYHKKCIQQQNVDDKMVVRETGQGRDRLKVYSDIEGGTITVKKSLLQIYHPVKVQVSAAAVDEFIRILATDNAIYDYRIKA